LPGTNATAVNLAVSASSVALQEQQKQFIFDTSCQQHSGLLTAACARQFVVAGHKYICGEFGCQRLQSGPAGAAAITSERD
jgi:hypothetical protein